MEKILVLRKGFLLLHHMPVYQPAIATNFLQNEAQLVEDGFALQGYQSFSGRFGGEDEYADSEDDMSYRNRPRSRPVMFRNSDSRLKMVPAGRRKQDMKRKNLTHGWLLEEVSLFRSLNSIFCDWGSL